MNVWMYVYILIKGDKFSRVLFCFLFVLAQQRVFCEINQSAEL